MVYTILRFAKRKGGAAKAIAAHNEQTKEAYASNPDIDKSRTVQNYHLIAPRWSYGQEIRHRISMAGCRVRRDSVKFVDSRGSTILCRLQLCRVACFVGAPDECTF